MRFDKFAEVARAARQRPEQLRHGDYRNADAESNPRAPVFKLKEKQKRANDKQDRQTVNMYKRQSSGEQTD